MSSFSLCLIFRGFLLLIRAHIVVCKFIHPIALVILGGLLLVEGCGNLKTKGNGDMTNLRS